MKIYEALSQLFRNDGHAGLLRTALSVVILNTTYVHIAPALHLNRFQMGFITDHGRFFGVQLSFSCNVETRSTGLTSSSLVERSFLHKYVTLAKRPGGTEPFDPILPSRHLNSPAERTEESCGEIDNQNPQT